MMNPNSSLLPGQTGCLCDVREPFRVLQIEQLVQRPVEVVGEVSDFLVEQVGRVRHDSPGRPPPARSTAKFSWQDGQVTAALVCPSALILR